MNPSVVKILKHIEESLKRELNISEITLEYIGEIENDRFTFEDVYNIVDALNFVSGTESVDRLIATFCTNWRISNGDWSRFLSGELKLKNPKKQEYDIQHRYIASVHITEHGRANAYLPAAALWSAMEYDIEMEQTDWETLDMWDSEWDVV